VSTSAGPDHDAQSDWRPACSLRALQQRAEVLATLRQYFAATGALEVHTPLLAAHGVTDVAIEPLRVSGGPDGVLQTSPEYAMKRLLAAGVGSCYQLGPAFRAGERGRHHNPEFTLLEWYRLGLDDRALRDDVAALVDRVLGPAPYDVVRYADLVAAELCAPGADPLALAEAFDEACSRLEGRVFIVDYPAAQAALARLRADDPRWAARFELVIDGLEIANGYYEAVDAAALEARFVDDQRQRRSRGLPVPELDRRFLAAVHAGLPDCAGVALGVDRLLMCRLGAAHIDEVLTFPYPAS